MYYDIDPNEVIAFGRYVRAARFKVMPPKFTMIAYEKHFNQEFRKLDFLTEKEQGIIRLLYHRLITYMMCLPASNVFHHRGPGGLFYHSLETASIFLDSANIEMPDPAMRLAGYVASILHDGGKALSYWQVLPCDPKEFTDYSFATGEAPVNPDDAWKPLEGSLWDWAKQKRAKYLALKFTGRQQLGHDASLRQFWRHLVPDELMDLLITKAPDTCKHMEGFLDGTIQDRNLKDMVQHADRTSVEWDIAPEYRVRPKRASLHLARRFLEYAATTPWNRYDSPFLFADVKIGDEGIEATLPFFRIWKRHLDEFRDFLLSQDLYGNAYRGSEDPWKFTQMLTATRLFCPLDPSIPGGDVGLQQGRFVPSVRATAHFPRDKLRGSHFEDLVFFPMGARLAWSGMEPAWVDLKLTE